MTANMSIVRHQLATGMGPVASPKGRKNLAQDVVLGVRSRDAESRSRRKAHTHSAVGYGSEGFESLGHDARQSHLCRS